MSTNNDRSMTNEITKSTKPCSRRLSFHRSSVKVYTHDEVYMNLYILIIVSCIYTISSKKAYRNAFEASSCRSPHPFIIAMEKTNLIVVSLMIGAYVLA